MIKNMGKYVINENVSDLTLTNVEIVFNSNVELNGCTFKQCIFNGIDIPNGIVKLEKCEFYKCDFCGKINGFEISECEFEECMFHDLSLYCGVLYVNKYVECEMSDILLSATVCMKLCDYNGCRFNKVEINEEFESLCNNIESNCKISYENRWIGNACPSDGAFIGWKICWHEYGMQYYLVKLEIPEDARRSSGFGKKCRASKVKVLGIYGLDGKRMPNDMVVRSMYTHDFEYRVGDVVEPTNPFDEDRFNECSSGIHFFIDKVDALLYIDGYIDGLNYGNIRSFKIKD